MLAAISTIPLNFPASPGRITVTAEDPPPDNNLLAIFAPSSDFPKRADPPLINFLVVFAACNGADIFPAFLATPVAASGIFVIAPPAALSDFAAPDPPLTADPATL